MVISGAVSDVAGVRRAVADRDRGTGHIRIPAMARAAFASEFAAALVAAKIPVIELAEVRPDLERVFLDLTRRPQEAA